MTLKRVQCPIVSQVQNFGFNNSLKSLLYQLPPLSWLVLPIGSSFSSLIFSAWKSCVRVSSLLLKLSVPFSNNWIVIFAIIQRHLIRSFKYFCLDIDECAVQNGGCSHDCENTPGSYECECPDAELSLAEDNHTCEGKHRTYLSLIYSTSNPISTACSSLNGCYFS